MRMLSLVLSSIIVLGAGQAVAQEKEKARPPKSGDTIIVEGCLNATMLEGASATPADGNNALLPSGLTYQLKGKKDVLKDLTAKHNGQVVEITGVLKSNIDTGSAHGTTIGKTRVVVGVQSTSPDRAMMPGTQELLPVLEVKSFESGAINCRR
jgi:hypothetical protein